MKNPVDTAVRQGVDKFGKVAQKVLNTNFSSIVGMSVGISVRAVTTAKVADILQGFENGVLVRANDAESGRGAGFLFATEDITVLADMMLMGDGEAKQALDVDSKDSINEMMGQFFSGMTVPVREILDKHVQFRVSAVSASNPVELTAENYVCYDMAGMLKGKGFAFRLYMDNILANKFDGESAIQVPTQSGEFRESADLNGANMDMLLDIDIPLSVRMGTAKLFLKDILGLGPGNIVELEQNVDDLVDLTVNDKLIARGEVVIVDGYFGFRIKEIVSKAERIKRLKD